MNSSTLASHSRISALAIVVVVLSFLITIDSEVFLDVDFHH